ncbi:KH domain-containing protein [Patescibacteria group bacterium]
MIDLVKYLVTQIVDNPDDITANESVDETGSIIITLTVHPDDMGKVIGKGGKIISAIREIVKVKAIKQQKRVRLILKDPENAAEATPVVEKQPTEEEISIDIPEDAAAAAQIEEEPVEVTQTDPVSQSEPQE